jgi:hypothetical protein
MRVDHRGGHIRVPEHLLHGADICSCAGACAGCAGAGQRLPGAAMHDMRLWMTDNALQIAMQGVLCVWRLQKATAAWFRMCIRVSGSAAIAL